MLGVAIGRQMLPPTLDQKLVQSGLLGRCSEFVSGVGLAAVFELPNGKQILGRLRRERFAQLASFVGLGLFQPLFRLLDFRVCGVVSLDDVRRGQRGLDVLAAGEHAG